jgi:putative DNA methylase
MSKSQRPQVFIEKIMPVKLLNEQVYYEHGGNPFKGLHRWYSRKPLSFSRASVLASLLPADISMDEFEYLLGLHPEKEGILVKKKEAIKLYKTPPSSLVIEKLEEYCEKVWWKRKPVVLDAFAGGGSIPFEAARYGLNVLASDLNPVAVVTMKAAMEYPLKFGADLQQDIDQWVKYVGDEAEKRLAEFFPSANSPLTKGGEGGSEKVQNYLWAHTIICPHCESVVPLSPNWWVDRSPGAAKKGQWCAVKPIPNPEKKRVDFELVKGSQGKSTTIETDEGEYDPDTTTTISRGVGKCTNCNTVIENDYICSPSQKSKLGHQLYAVSYKEGKSSLQFRIPTEVDLKGIALAEEKIAEKISEWESHSLISHEATPTNPQYSMIRNYGVVEWAQCFNPRQLLTLVTYVEIINEAKSKLQIEYEPEKVEAIATYLALVCDRCADRSCRLARWDACRTNAQGCSAQHALNLMWNYPESSGAYRLWEWCADTVASDYTELHSYFGSKSDSPTIPGFVGANVDAPANPLGRSPLQCETPLPQINASSADNLFHIPDRSVDAIITDPPYYGTVPYADLSDFFYVWQKRTLGDIFPDLFWSELTDKDREAVANPSRFRNMGASPEELAKQD